MARDAEAQFDRDARALLGPGEWRDVGDERPEPESNRAAYVAESVTDGPDGNPSAPIAAPGSWRDRPPLL